MLTEKNEDELIKSVLKNGPDILNLADQSDDLSQYKKIITKEKLKYPGLDFRSNGDWLIPEYYQNMDIEKFLIEICPKENYNRLMVELEFYKKYDMMNVLKAMKFLVDKFRENRIVWGVGRGSSVSSYILYLIGVHKIDSVKYDLSINEFFKGEKHGENLQDYAG